MDNIKLRLLDFFQQGKAMLILVGGAGAVLGLLLGLAVGWWWWPVRWENSTPANLRPDFQGDYIGWVADGYGATGDLGWARGKLGAEFWKDGQLSEALEGLAAQETDGQAAIRLLALKQSLMEEPLAESSEPAPVDSEAPEPVSETEGGTNLLGSLRSVGAVCGVGLLVAAVVGGAVLLVIRWRGSRLPSQPGEAAIGMAGEGEDVDLWGVGGQPLAQYPTTYALGDDNYDPSFSIELQNGEFIGECGVGISETIGVDPPNKVTAFEVWLFDKNDIRTVTRVLMSDYAFHDDALRTKLAPKGEPVLVEEGKDIAVETKTLRMRARIVEATYGTGSLPPDSFFENLTVELAVWSNPQIAQASAPPADAQTVPDLPVMPPSL